MTVDERRPGSRLLGTQVAALMLLSLLPVAWLIGRRTAPGPAPVPILLGSGRSAIALRAAPPGLADRVGPTELPALSSGAGGYRLDFDLTAPKIPGRPPYRMQLTGPGGAVLWQEVWNEIDASPPASAGLILPAAMARPGRYTLVVEDASGRIRMFPFLVP
jgi:hypothetical protein